MHRVSLHKKAICLISNWCKFVLWLGFRKVGSYLLNWWYCDLVHLYRQVPVVIDPVLHERRRRSDMYEWRATPWWPPWWVRYSHFQFHLFVMHFTSHNIHYLRVRAHLCIKFYVYTAWLSFCCSVMRATITNTRPGMETDSTHSGSAKNGLLWKLLVTSTFVVIFLRH